MTVNERRSPVTLTLANSAHVNVWIENVEPHQLQIWGNLTIAYPVESIWPILTDYEALPSFIPHLVKSQRIPHPKSRLRLEQVGAKSLLKFQFTARAILDLFEQFSYLIQFQLVEKDFQSLSGECRFQEETSPSGTVTQIHFFVQLIPKLSIPSVLLKKLLQKYLSFNLVAIHQHVSQVLTQKSAPDAQSKPIF